MKEGLEFRDFSCCCLNRRIFARFMVEATSNGR